MCFLQDCRAVRLSEDHTSGRRFQFQKTKQVRMLVWSKTRSCFTIDDVSHIHLDHFELSPNGCQAATCSYYDWTKFCKNHTNIIWTSKNGSCTVSVLVCILPDSLWICWNMLECCEDKCIIMHPNLLFSFRCIKTCLVRLSLHDCLELSFERNKVGTCPEDLTTKRKQRIQDIWLRLQKRFSANVVLSCQPLQ